VNPDDLKYTRSHEWVRVDGELGTIGITDHAQKQLGEIVYLELPEVGHVYNANEEFGTVESVKAVSELFTPVAGRSRRGQQGGGPEPGIINDDPFGDGWLVRLKLSSDADADGLLSADDYEKYVREEEQGA
jgi:glycine cleavage system H protein